MRTTKVIAAAAFALLVAAACSSSGGLGDVFGTNSRYDIRGTVDSVDTASRSIWLTNATGYNTSLASGSSGSAVRVYYNDNTTVTFQGRNYRPQDLERGDEVTVHAAQSGSQVVAESMDVTYNSHGSMTSSSSSTVPYGSVLHGTVRAVDTHNRTVTIDRGYGSNVIVSYNTSTPVYWNGQTYAPGALEVGDEIDIRTTDLGGGRLGASDITVTRNVSNSSSSGTYGNSSNYATYRGTIRSVDTYNRTITLDSASWMSGFRTTTSGNTMVISYDTNARVSYNGQLYPLTNLERGDVVDVQVSGTSGNWLAQNITLVRDVNR
jgi:hypothetical protein